MLSKMLELRAMATPAKAVKESKRARSLIELKGVDSAYPLRGEMVLSPAMTLQHALAKRGDGIFGAVADASLLKRLGLDLDALVKVGTATLRITAIIKSEPDRKCLIQTRLHTGYRHRIGSPRITQGRQDNARVQCDVPRALCTPVHAQKMCASHAAYARSGCATTTSHP